MQIPEEQEETIERKISINKNNNKRLSQDSEDAQGLQQDTTIMIKTDEEEKKPTKRDTFYERPNIWWITKSMAEEFGREEVLRATFRESIIFATFLVFTTIFALGNRSASMYYITRALQEQFVERSFDAHDRELTFDQIRSAEDFWEYSESILLEGLFWEHYYDTEYGIKDADTDDRKVLYENKILGVPRMRQLRVRNDSCVIHEYFRRLFLSCYAEYSLEAEDRNPFGLGTGTAWTYSDAKTTRCDSYEGEVAYYDGGGFYIDLTDERDSTQEKIHNLKTNLWITRNTRVIFISFSLYNANLNLFAVVKLIFEFPPTGGIIPSSSIHALKLLDNKSTYDYVVKICEGIFYVFIIYFICEELREIVYFKWKYFLDFWTYVDLIIIGAAAFTLSGFLKIKGDVAEALQDIERNPHSYGNLEILEDVYIFRRVAMAIVLFFVYIKTFKYLNFNRTMGQLNNTLNKCAMDIVGFSIMFFIIFFAFAELGYLLFGNKVSNFSTFGKAMFTLLRTILGDFDYDAIQDANKLLAPIYFLSYIFFVFFVLLNMFLAIINDTYSDVKTEIAIAPEEMQMTEYLKRRFMNCLRRIGFKIKEHDESEKKFNVTIQQIQETLKKCGFTDMEIGMFFARYNIDPLAKVAESDAEKLMKDLEAAQPGGPQRGNFAQHGFVHVNDFNAQQKKLEDIEKKIDGIYKRILQLLNKLEAIEAAKKKQQTSQTGVQ